MSEIREKRSLKEQAITLLIVAVIALVICSGNPFTKNKVKESAEKYLEENYAGTDYYVEKVNFKMGDTNHYHTTRRSTTRSIRELGKAMNGDYTAVIRSKSSEDMSFLVYADKKDKVAKSDNYDEVYGGKLNTYNRINDEYRKLVESVITSNNIGANIFLTQANLRPKTEEKNRLEHRYTNYLDIDTLELDKIYDYGEIGSLYGDIYISFEEKEVSREDKKIIILNVKKALDSIGVKANELTVAFDHECYIDYNNLSESTIDSEIY